VIVVALQHGTAMGLLTALLCSGINALLTVPHDLAGGDFYAVWLRVWLAPALWIGTALVLGGLRTRQVEQAEMLSRDLSEARLTVQSLFTYNATIQERLQGLERQVAGGGQLLAPDLVEALLAFRQSGSPETALPSLFDALFGSGEYELTPREKGIEPGAKHVSRPTVFSLLDTDNDIAEKAGALFVCALHDPAGGRRLGTLAVLKVDRWSADIDERVMLLASEVSVALSLLTPSIPEVRPRAFFKARRPYAERARRAAETAVEASH
jgi:hypothetical protein